MAEKLPSGPDVKIVVDSIIEREVRPAERTVDPKTGLPLVRPTTFRTGKRTPYVCGTGVSVVARTVCYPAAMEPFLVGYDEPDWVGWSNDAEDVSPGGMLAKTAGQLCYLSFGKGATPHSKAQQYLDHIKESRHGSVLEHASISLMLWGIDRAVSHEIVRHRVGMGFSQVSQRYVDNPRFVLSPEYTSTELQQVFYEDIDRAQERYDLRAEMLMRLYPLAEEATREQKRDHRKRVNSAARRVLPNETEAPIVCTANLRAWRHIVEQRDSRWADAGIRLPADDILWVLKQMEPEVFSDYEAHPEGGVSTKYVKV